jgi:ketosteroid isomerase-like protein
MVAYMTRAAIKHAEERLRDAMLRGDVEALDDLIADELVFCMPDGRVLGKEDDLEAYRSGAQTITRAEPSELHIELHEHTAVVTVRVQLEGTASGRPFGGAFRYMRTYVRAGDGWKIVAGSVTAITS